MSLAALPGEVLVKIVADVLFDPVSKQCQQVQPSASGDLPSSGPGANGCRSPASSGPTHKVAGGLPPIELAKEVQVLRSLCTRLSQATEMNVSHRFHMFDSPHGPIVRAHCKPWMPTLAYNNTTEYWRFHLATKEPTANQIRLQSRLFDRANASNAVSVKVDARIASYEYIRNVANMGAFQEWCACFSLLSRISRPNPALKTLHMRLSLNTDLAFLVEHIIRDGTALTDVVIEADFPQPLNLARRPLLSLQVCHDSRKQYSTLERFILRAPGLDVRSAECADFFGRLHGCKTVCFAVNKIVLPATSVLQFWVHNLTTSVPIVERLEVSVGNDTSRRVVMPNTTTVEMSNLIHLVLDFQHVTANQLSLIRAPALRYLSLRSGVPIGCLGFCEPGHFPSLFSASIFCEGGVFERFRALGLAKRQFRYGLPLDVKDLFEYDGDVHCYITKFNEHPSDINKPWHKRRRLA